MYRFYRLMSLLAREEITRNSFNDYNFLKSERSRLVCIFFEILKEENSLEKINEINRILVFKEKKLLLSEAIREKNFLDADEETLLVSFIVLKSLNKVTTFESTDLVNYVNSYEFLNTAYLYIENFCIFFYHKIPIKKKYIKYLLFSLAVDLCLNKVILERTKKVGFKTIIEWSSGVKFHKINDFDYLNICFSKPEIIEVENLKYLKGAFMNRVQEIFKPNQNSGERVILKDLSFIELLSREWVKVDEHMFEYIVKSIEKDIGFSISEVPKFIEVESMLFNEKIKRKADEKNLIIAEFNKDYLKEKIKYSESLNISNAWNVPYLLFLRHISLIFLDEKKIKSNANLISLYVVSLYNFGKIVSSIKNRNLRTKLVFENALNPLNYENSAFLEECEEKNSFTEEGNFSITLDLDKDLIVEEYINDDETFNIEKIQITENEIKTDFDKVVEQKESVFDTWSVHQKPCLIDFNEDCWFLFTDKKKLTKELRKKSKVYFKKNTEKDFANALNFYKKTIMSSLNIKYEEDADLSSILKNVERLEIFKIIDIIGNEFIDKYWKNLNKNKSLYKVCLKWDNREYSTNLSRVTEKLYIFKKEIMVIQKEYSRISKYMLYNNITILKNNLKFIDKIYFLFFFDFRGRFYPRSPIGVTELKLSRFFYYYGEYSEEEVNDNSENYIHGIIQSYKNEIDTVKSLFCIKRNSNIIDHGVFWVIIAISKIFLEKNKVKTSRNCLILSSIERITLGADNLTSEEAIEYYYYTYLLKNLSKVKIKKLPVHKDATASVLQNLIRIMGYKDENSLNFCNLNDSLNWYDTYALILEKWLDFEKKNISYKPEDYVIFTRKTIKEVIMTKPYAAKYLPSFKRFREKVSDTLNIWIEFGSKEEAKFKAFYRFLEEDLEKSFFLKNSSNKMVTYFAEEFDKEEGRDFWIDSHDSSVNLVYYKFVTKTYDLVIKIPSENKKIRKTKKWLELDKTKINKKKIMDSIRANWVQNTDSIFIRDILKEMREGYLTIHDCVLVDVLKVSDFIIAANKVVNVEIFVSIPWDKGVARTSFSIFIFL